MTLALTPPTSPPKQKPQRSDYEATFRIPPSRTRTSRPVSLPGKIPTPLRHRLCLIRNHLITTRAKMQRKAAQESDRTASVFEGKGRVKDAAAAADIVAVLVLLAAPVVVLDLVAVHASIGPADGFIQVRGVCHPVTAEGDGQFLLAADQLTQAAEARLEVELFGERHQHEEFVTAHAVGILTAVALREQVAARLSASSPA